MEQTWCLTSRQLHKRSEVISGIPFPLLEGMIMSFDVNSEGFRKLSLPHASIDTNTIHSCLASFKGKLALITHGRSEQLGVGHSIWVMREYGVAQSWNKIFFLPYETLSDCSAFT